MTTGVSPSCDLNLEDASTSTKTSEESSTFSNGSSKEAVEKMLDGLVGVWKLQKSDNFDNYLKAQGVGCMARALVSFLDFKIGIKRKKNGLKVTIHDYVSSFKIGVAHPLLEHPVTKKKDQMVIVNEEDGKLVCRIWTEKGLQDPPDNGDGKPERKKDDKISKKSGGASGEASGGAEGDSGDSGGEVLTLGLVEDEGEQRIKQTLEYENVVAVRWYVRDPATAAAAAATATAAADASSNVATGSQKDGSRKNRTKEGKKGSRRQKGGEEETEGGGGEEGEGEEEEEEGKEDDETKGETERENNENTNNDIERRPRRHGEYRRRRGQRSKLQCILAISFFLYM